MRIHKNTNPVAAENTYYVEGEQEILVIDPGSNWTVIQEKIQQLQKPITAILLTHTHYDHILSLEKVRETFGHPPVYVAKEEASWLMDPIANLSGLPRHADLEDVICQPAENLYQYDHLYHLGEFQFLVLHTPGHSAGGVSLLFPDQELVFSGDALFRGSIGRVDLPTGNLETLLTSIRQELFTLPSHYTVYPGHGGDTTIGHEKNFNPFF